MDRSRGDHVNAQMVLRRENIVEVRRWSAIIGSGLASLVLAACGGSLPRVVASTSVATSTAPLLTPAGPGLRAPTSTTDAEVEAAPGPCTAEQLTARQTWQGALGTEVGYIALKNTSPRTCSMSGYPGFVPIGPSGGSLPVAVVHREGLNCAPPAGFCTRPGMGPPVEIELHSGDEAFFGFTYTGIAATSPDGSPYPCDQGVSTSVVPPGQAGSLMVAGEIAPCGPDYQVTISPVYAGGPPGGQGT